MNTEMKDPRPGIAGVSNSDFRGRNSEAGSKKQPRGGRRSRQKGDRIERAIVRVPHDHGFAAQRIPLFGAAASRYAGDLIGLDRRVEVKCRASGFAQLYAWFARPDILVVKRDRDEPLVVVPMSLAVEVVKAAKRGRI